jgi:hypothetical protein
MRNLDRIHFLCFWKHHKFGDRERLAHVPVQSLQFDLFYAIHRFKFFKVDLPCHY